MGTPHLGIPHLETSPPSLLGHRGSSLPFVSFWLRNPTEDLCPVSKDSVPIGVTWKTCSGQIHGASEEFSSIGEGNIISELRDGRHRAGRGGGNRLNHGNVSLYGTGK